MRNPLPAFLLSTWPNPKTCNDVSWTSFVNVHDLFPSIMFILTITSKAAFAHPGRLTEACEAK